MYMLQSFGNNSGFILEKSVISNGQDQKNASVIYSETGLLPNFHTDSTSYERVESQFTDGLKRSGQINHSFHFRKFRNEWYAIYDRIVPQLIVLIFFSRVLPQLFKMDTFHTHAY